MLTTLICCFPALAGAQLAEGDRAWASRAMRLEGRLAEESRIEAAIDSYRAALEGDIASLEARWKLLRALHYLIDFSNADAPRRDAALKEAVALAKTSIPLLEEAIGGREAKAHLYFWSAIVWGARGQRVGLLTIVREGVARRMHDHAERSLALDPDASVDRGGALRLLSRLHATLPRVPFVSGWVDREQVRPLAERAYALDSAHPGNRLVLALALLETAPNERARAIALLESVVQGEPQPDLVVEELSIRDEAREKLAELELDSG